jgi:hypothetical protein
VKSGIWHMFCISKTRADRGKLVLYLESTGHIYRETCLTFEAPKRVLASVINQCLSFEVHCCRDYTYRNKIIYLHKCFFVYFEVKLRCIVNCRCEMKLFKKNNEDFLLHFTQRMAVFQNNILVCLI